MTIINNNSITKRLPVSDLQNSYYNAQQVDQEDLVREQDFNNAINFSILQNHFGSGILPSITTTSTILFDSDQLTAVQNSLLVSGNFDGSGLLSHLQPLDSILGSQLVVELIDSLVIGRKGLKVAIIGLDFNNNLQMDRLYFFTNEIQVTGKHYKKILAILFNDFKGNNNCSKILGGRVIIKEAESFQLSRSCLMIAQDLEPDLFWRDFKVSNSNLTLAQTLQLAIGSSFNIDSLNINITGQVEKQLLPNNVLFQVGQKFQAETNQIQKITVLLGVSKDTVKQIDQQFDWLGDLVVSLYALSTKVIAPSEIVPDLVIEFDPQAMPIVQLSYNQAALKATGYLLTDVLQPVDFVFSNTKIANPNSQQIIPGNYYIVTFRRSGSANDGTLLFGSGLNRQDLLKTRLSYFTGSSWLDLPDQSLWFQIWTSAAKIASGQGYDTGQGLEIEKSTLDFISGSNIDNNDQYHSLITSGENVVNIAILEAVVRESSSEPSLQTGTPVKPLKTIVPNFNFVTQDLLTTLQETKDPLILGSVKDHNPKNNLSFEKFQGLPGLVSSDQFIVVEPDADLLSLNLLGSKLSPNNLNCNQNYLIVKTIFCQDYYGDINGDGIIDQNDSNLLAQLLGESLSFQTSQQKIVDGYFTTLNLLLADLDGDGYVTANDKNLLDQFLLKKINSFPVGSSFSHLILELQNTIGRYDGYYDCNLDGYIRLASDGYFGEIIDTNQLNATQVLFDGYEIPVNLLQDDIFTTVPFPGVNYKITPLPFWQDYQLLVNSKSKKVACSFSYPNANLDFCQINNASKCLDPNKILTNFDSGRNDYYFPGNIVVDNNSQIILPNGDYFKTDLEIGLVILELPTSTLNNAIINIFEKFVAENPVGSQMTLANYPAMNYADCSKVQRGDLFLNRIRFAASIQSLTPNPNFDGYSDGYGQFLTEEISLVLDQTTGLLNLTIKDLLNSSLLATKRSKILIEVFLKKGGWNNNSLIVPADQILGLISS